MLRNRIGLIIILFFGCQNWAVSDENGGGNTLYFGYYIYTLGFRDVLIVKLSLQEKRGYYLLERFSIENNELIEEEKTILNRQINYRRSGNPYRMVFIEKNKEIHYTNNFVVFDINEDINNILRINYYINNHNHILSFETSYFTKDSGEIIDIIKSNYSEDTYIGKFVLDEYEIINIQNMENPINEKEEILVDVYERRNDLLCLTHAPTHTSLTGEVKVPFLPIKENDIHRISKRWADGDNWGYSYRYYFLNKDTIIFEYEWGGLNDDNEFARIEYRIKFTREKI